MKAKTTDLSGTSTGYKVFAAVVLVLLDMAFGGLIHLLIGA